MEHWCLLASLAVFLPRAIRGKAGNTGRQNGRSAVNTACHFPTTVAVFLVLWARLFLLLWARVRWHSGLPWRLCAEESGVGPKLALSKARRSFHMARAEARALFWLIRTLASSLRSPYRFLVQLFRSAASPSLPLWLAHGFGLVVRAGCNSMNSERLDPIALPQAAGHRASHIAPTCRLTVKLQVHRCVASALNADGWQRGAAWIKVRLGGSILGVVFRPRIFVRNGVPPWFVRPSDERCCAALIGRVCT